MAFMHVNFSSSALEMPTDLHVIIPQRDLTPGAQNAVPEKRPVLWLLHGMYGCYSDWVRLTSIERYANEHGLAVVMPSGENAFYTDMVHGERYFTYIADELPAFCRDMFPLSDRPEDNYIAGLSMGGYGAMKIGLTYPERYAAVCSLSGVLHVGGFVQTAKESMPKLFHNIFGDIDPTNTCHDPVWLLRQHMEKGTKLPALYAYCGTEDFLFRSNEAFRDICREVGAPLHYKTQPGVHDWAFWDNTIRQFIESVR